MCCARSGSTTRSVRPRPTPPRSGLGSNRKLGKSDATYEAAVKNVYAVHNERDDGRNLIGAHVVAGVAEVDRGVAARAFAAMGLDRERVARRGPRRRRPPRRRSVTVGV